MPDAPDFLDYTPVELTFGTSGLRGLVRDLTDLEVYVSVKGALAYLLGSGNLARRSDVVLGGDLRPSTERIMRAAAQAITDSGLGIDYVGLVPTPALFLHAVEQHRAGVMVTGSHIPFDRNGIKINRADGELLKRDEPGVMAEIRRVRRQEYAKDAATSAFDAHGMLKRAPSLPPRDPGAERRYVARYLVAFPVDVLSGWRVAFWAHSAVGRELIPQLLMALGAEVVIVGHSDEFVPIDTENIGEAQLETMRRLAASVAPVDAIVSTDGDSDRPLVAAVQPDGRVRFLPGDLVGLVVADYLRADAVAVPVSANDAIDAQLHERGVTLHKTRIGSPYVIEAITDARRAGATRAVGWEANGGFLVGSELAVPGGSLSALPSRDAVLPIVANLVAASQHGISLAQLWDQLPARFGRSALLDDVPPAVSRLLVDALDQHEAERLFTPAHGFGRVVAIDTTDGARIRFSNRDVVHVRASGNAPQLRVYGTADSPARAEEIVQLGLAILDDLVRHRDRNVAA